MHETFSNNDIIGNVSFGSLLQLINFLIKSFGLSFSDAREIVIFWTKWLSQWPVSYNSLDTISLRDVTVENFSKLMKMVMKVHSGEWEVESGIIIHKVEIKQSDIDSL